MKTILWIVNDFGVNRYPHAGGCGTAGRIPHTRGDEPKLSRRANTAMQAQEQSLIFDYL